MDLLRAEKPARQSATAALQELSAATHALALAPRVAVLVPCYNEAKRSPAW